MSTLKYRPVMSAQVPIPSTVLETIDSSYSSLNNGKHKTTLKPFQFLIDDKVLEVPGYQYYKNIFLGFKFILEDTILLLKTMNNKYVVVYKSQKPERPYELFSTQGEYIFDEIIDINCNGGGLSKVFAFCVKKHNDNYQYVFQKCSKKIFLHKIGWHFTPNALNGLDPEMIMIQQSENENTKSFDVSELFGPLPQWPENSYDYRYAKNPWWVALCSDDKYRIMHNSYGKLAWVTTKDGFRTEIFKRFIPITKPNYFYFLTMENEELLLHAYEEYSSLEHALEKARKGMNENRVNPYYDRGSFGTTDAFLFPGIKYETWPEKNEEKIIPGVFNQQENLGW